VGFEGARTCPVYATQETWTGIGHYPIERRERVTVRAPFELAGIVFEAFPVEHSLRAPAVGYRIGCGGTVVFYAPDLVEIPEQDEVLRGIRIYIGDGASLTRSIVRRRNGVRIGHASIREQLDWCATEGVSRAVFTHCGSQIVRAEQAAQNRVAALGRERGIRATIAHDDLRIALH
jgi:phosphoribosyl 1,2-cyclic phosphodiesterase